MRLPGGRPKQYGELAGRPMLWHAIRAVCVPLVAKVFVVLAPEDTRFAEEDWRASRPSLAAWFEQFAKRPSIATTGPQEIW